MKTRLLVGFLSLVSISSLLFAYDRDLEARHQKELAELYRRQAEEQRNLALQARNEAEMQRMVALSHEQARVSAQSSE